MWNLNIDGGSEVYVRNDLKFVARFKYANKKASANHFVKFLKANFTPDEYFAKLDAGVPPITILNSKGYVSYNVQKLSALNT